MTWQWNTGRVLLLPAFHPACHEMWFPLQVRLHAVQGHFQFLCWVTIIPSSHPGLRQLVRALNQSHNSTCLAACTLLTFYFPLQKCTEDVLKLSSLLISHLMFLIMHQIQPLLLVAQSTHKRTRSPITHPTFKEFRWQQEYCCISTVAGWCCPVPAPPCAATLFHFTPVVLWSQWSPIRPWVCHCILGQHTTMCEEKHKFPCHVPENLSLLPFLGDRVGVAGGQWE